MTAVAEAPAPKQKSKGKPDTPETVARNFAFETIQSVSQAIGWLQTQDQATVDLCYTQCGVIQNDAIDLAAIRPVVEKVKLWEMAGTTLVSVDPVTEASQAAAAAPVTLDEAASTPCADPECTECANAVAPAPGDVVAETSAAGEGVSLDSTVGITETDEQWLSLRAEVIAARDMVAKARLELCDREEEYDEAKKARDGAKTALEAAWLRLEAAVNGQLQPAKAPLFEGEWRKDEKPVTPPDPADVEAVRAWEQEWEKFLDTPITQLDVPSGIQEKLASHSSPVRNLRELVALTSDQYHPEGYQQVQGIGQGKADQIQEAFDKLMNAFLAEHPRPKAMQAPGLSSETPNVEAWADPAWDFESVFPPLINPSSPNEVITDDDHRLIVKDTIEGQQEVSTLKKCLADGVDQDGKKLTDKKRQKLETSLGESESLHEDGLASYRERFGEAAEKALRQHVDGQVERQSKLKGGLD